MLAPDWTWWTTVPLIVVTVLLVWIPGALLASGLGAGRWQSVAIAPILSVSLFSVGGIAFDLAGISWGVGPMLVCGLVVPGLVWAVRLALARSGRKLFGLETPTVDVRAVVLGTLVAAGVAVGIIVAASGRPGDIPQMPDVISHLGMVRYFLDHRTISSLVADGFNRPSAPGFYPAAFHGIAATLVMIMHVPVVVADAVVLLVASAFVWPLGLMFLVGSLLDARPRALIATGLVGAAATGFPYLLLVYGPLWPLAFAFAHLPVVIALFGLGVRQAFAGKSFLSAALMFVLALPGLALAHTSAVFVVAVACFAILAAALARHGAESSGGWLWRWAPLVGLLVAGIGAVVVLAYLAPEGLRKTNYGHVVVPKGLALLVTLWSSRDNLHQLTGFLLLALTVLGAVVAFRIRGAWWLPATWLWFLALAFATNVVDATVTWPLTWPWYNVAVRMQAIAVIFGAPLAGLGLGAVFGAALRLPRVGRPAAGLVGVLACLLVAGQVSATVYHVNRYYLVPSKERARLTPAEADALRQISAILPDDAVVAANPWKGGQYLQAIGPETSLVPTETAASLDPEMMLVASRLDQVRDDPAVCAAVHRDRVTYALTGGRQTWASTGRNAAYRGIDAVSEAKGFRPITRSGPYTLWEVPPCKE